MPLTIRQTKAFAIWLNSLKDARAAARIDLRIRRLALGNPGDVKSLGGGLSELRIDYGPGYRVYFARIGDRIVLLLVGGDKRRQSTDIEMARNLLAQWKD